MNFDFRIAENFWNIAKHIRILCFSSDTHQVSHQKECHDTFCFVWNLRYSRILNSFNLRFLYFSLIDILCLFSTDGNGSALFLLRQKGEIFEGEIFHCRGSMKSLTYRCSLTNTVSAGYYWKTCAIFKNHKPSRSYTIY